MEYEDYLVESYAPTKAIELLSDIIYDKSNNDWSLFSKMTREHGEELLALNYTINLCAKHLLRQRQDEISKL